MANVDLLFSRAPLGPGSPVNLVFGDSDAAPAIPDATVNAAGQITGIRQPLGMALGVRADAAGRITGIRQSIGAVYDTNVSRATVAGTRAVWQDAQPVTAPTSARYRQALRTPARVRVRWQDADKLAAGHAVRWQDSQQLTRRVGVVFEQAQRLPSAPHTVRFAEAVRLRNAVAGAFEQARRLPANPFTARFEETYRDRQAQVASAFQTALLGVGLQVAGGMGIALRKSQLFEGAFEQAWSPRPGRWTPTVPPPVDNRCYFPELPAHLLFDAPANTSLPAHLVFVCDPGGGGPIDPDPPPGAIRVVPIRAVYIVTNNITLHRVDTGAELHAHSFSMSLDYQSWTWSWQASLHADAAPHLGRDAQGDPAELQVQVNGTPFRLRLVSVSRDRRFSPTRWSVSGQGKAAVLAGPWAPKLSFGNPAADRTAQQLTADALTINGVPIGWAIEWGLTDWAVPAGAWSLQGTYIDAINDIAASVGGYVQPHPTAATLRILPRYPAVPWAWGSITPDFEIPEDAAEVEGTQYVDRPAYNRVFVGGIGAGVFGPFTRAGTAGNSVAPQATHALITDAPAHRQRGIAVLSDTGRQEHITLNMQVLPETGVIVPGQFVRYLSPTPKLGIVRSTSIDWSRPKLRQTIRVETHV